ncbi:hypothetical protein JHK82_012348 [Glycine max]|nr:hypothetical protein JHK85_012704 [Glycine max]KAG5057370.1 hypothetical protein JHK86_012366 [Glycine max]KAG5154379.1 hypothetical protein JHK82_012348 [Glycine max]
MRMNPKRNCINGDDTFRVHHAGRGNRVRMDVDLGQCGLQFFELVECIQGPNTFFDHIGEGAEENEHILLTTLKSMETDGTWAGHMELQAASPVTRSNVCIHRHYNSVRLKDDPFDGPARPIADADLSVPSHQTKVVDNKPHGRAGREAFQPGSIRMVMAGTGCENAEKVEQVK